MIKLAIKDLRLFVADKRSMLLTFLLPMTLITLFAFVFGGVGGGSDKKGEYELLICDEDNTEASKDAVLQFDTLKTLKLLPEKLETARDLVMKGKRDALLLIHKGFADSLAAGNSLPIELQYDEAKEVEIGMLQQALFSTVAMLPYRNNANMKQSMFKSFDKMLPANDQQIKRTVHLQFDTLFKTLSKGIEAREDTASVPAFGFGTSIKMTKLLQANNDNVLGLLHAVAGTAIMMLLFSVAGMGASLLDEKQEGTLKKLLYSPIAPQDILFGKIIYTNIVCILQLSVMFIYAWLAFKLDIVPHILSLLMMILATAFACSAFGVVLASFARSRQQVQGLSTLIVLTMSCIGGSMVPTFAMPAFMQKISVFSVNYWGIQGFYDIFWRQLPPGDPTFLSRLGVLLLIGLVLNLVAFRMFKRNILKIA